MKTFVLVITLISIMTACNNSSGTRNQILQTEKDFEKMASEKGIAEAFYFFADENAVIKRENDTLIMGKEQIKAYYLKTNPNATVTWAPDFIDISKCGTLGYTYGKYVWKSRNDRGDTISASGIFHTVWKRQRDNTWKYVWD